MISVSSAFNNEMESTNPSSLYRTFIFPSSFYENRILSYGKITRQGETLASGGIQLKASNTDQYWNLLKSSPSSVDAGKALFLDTGTILFGFGNPNGVELNETSYLWDADKLLSLWHMNSSWADDKGGNDGTRFGNGTEFETSSQRIGTGAGKFNGIDDYVHITTNQNSYDFVSSTSKEATISLWLNTSVSSGTILSKYTSGSAGPFPQGYYLEINSTGRASFTSWNTVLIEKTSTRTNSTPIADGTWHHLALTLTRGGGISTDLSFYVDGEPDGSYTIPTPARNTGRQLRIGTRIESASTATRFFNGEIDEVAIWTGRTLTADEIKLFLIDHVQMFKGQLTTANPFKKSGITLLLRDSSFVLKNKEIGNTQSAVAFTGSEWNPGDLFWTIATSYGELSNVASTSNQDIDYNSWLQWKDDLDILSIQIQANFNGTPVFDAINKIARISDSTITAEGDGKIYCRRNNPTLTSSAYLYTDTNMKDIQLGITANEIINDGRVFFGYNPSSGLWAGEYTNVSTGSVNSYGTLNIEYGDTTVWHANSASAQSFLDRIMINLANPVEHLKIDTFLMGVQTQVGDLLRVTNEAMSYDANYFEVDKLNVNLDTGIVKIDAFGIEDRIAHWFFLDDAVQGLLDKDYNFLY